MVVVVALVVAVAAVAVEAAAEAEEASVVIEAAEEVVVVVEAEAEELAVDEAEVEEAEEEVLVEDPREEPRLSSNNTDTRVSSLLKERLMPFLPRTWFPESPCTEKSELLLMFLRTKKLNIEFGILSDLSWLLPFWVV